MLSKKFVKVSSCVLLGAIYSCCNATMETYGMENVKPGTGSKIKINNLTSTLRKATKDLSEIASKELGRYKRMNPDVRLLCRAGERKWKAAYREVGLIKKLDKQIANKFKESLDLIKKISNENVAFVKILQEILLECAECNPLGLELYKNSFFKIEDFNSAVEKVKYYKESLIKLFDVFEAVLTGEEYVPQSDVANIYYKLLKLERLFSQEITRPIREETQETQWSYCVSKEIRAKLLEGFIKCALNSALNEPVFCDFDTSLAKEIEGELARKKELGDGYDVNMKSLIERTKDAILGDKWAFIKFKLVGNAEKIKYQDNNKITNIPAPAVVAIADYLE